MRKEFDIYKTGRSRRASDCSSSHSCHSRKVSECRSECPSLSTSPGSDFVPGNVPNGSSGHRSQSIPVNRAVSRTMFTRTPSRTSQSSLITTPSKGSTGCSPPKPTAGSQGSLNSFHRRLVDKLRKSLRKARSEDRSWETATTAINHLSSTPPLATDAGGAPPVPPDPTVAALSMSPTAMTTLQFHDAAAAANENCCIHQSDSATNRCAHCCRPPSDHSSLDSQWTHAEAPASGIAAATSYSSRSSCHSASIPSTMDQELSSSSGNNSEHQSTGVLPPVLVANVAGDDYASESSSIPPKDKSIGAYRRCAASAVSR